MKKLIMMMVLMPMMALAASNLYMVIDLSGGTSAVSYPVNYLDAVPDGGWTDEYKTSKLVLRRIEPGSFKMCGEYDVTLTKPFYFGVFEVTQKQYELVTGMNPSEYKGDMRPVEMVSYDAIRGSVEGAKWPESSAVDSNSFMGKLRARTGLDFDLPTEAQWEYACRAGTTSLYNNGGSTENDLNQLGRYVNNGSSGKGGYSEHTTVGSYLPNAWGLYDMHGNVLERCLDWYGTLTNGADLQGPSSGTERVRRGGAFCWYADWCTSVYRDTGWFGACIAPSDAYDGDGFRLSLTITTPLTLRDGLVAYWPFDGNANDASGNGNHGTTHGVTLTTDRFGNANGAYYFGEGNYISVEDSDSLNSPSNQITIATWIRIDDWYWLGNPFAAILNKGDRQYSFNLWGYANETGTEVGQDLFAMFEVLPEMREWCHLAVTYSEGYTHSYLNGNLVGKVEGLGQFITQSATLEIGRDVPVFVEYLNGVLDDLRIYNRALPAVEVKALYDGTGMMPTIWYVNGSTGSDSNSGTSESTPKATIQAAIDVSAEGDMILVAPGTYAPITTVNKAITIRAIGGVTNTIIDGGSNNVCVMVWDKTIESGIQTNTVVHGFTLQNGYSLEDGGCVRAGMYFNCILQGGCSVYGSGGCAAHAVLENCLVKGGRGVNGGNLVGSIARNCTLIDGYATDNGGAFFDCSVYNSICYNNDSGWRSGDDGGTS